MGTIDYRKIYEKNQDEWKALTREPQKYEALLAGHYSDSNHFVYELLQNAEDEKADTVVIEFYKNRLVFYHNGDPFDESDVIGVSSMLMGTKDRDDAQTIGRFGMGFKSVFKYTDQPEIYSDNEAFVIKNYLLPEELTESWDYQAQKKSLIYPDKEGGGFYPFTNSEHLTRIIIPFYKRNSEGIKEYSNGSDVLQKLKSLTGEILLFLTYIRDLYWINKETREYVHITLGQAADDPNLITCRISSLYKNEEISRYLKYKKTFNHPEMKSAEVSVAYRVNAQVKNVLEIEDSPVWVYFPTREETDLPFLIHGSFETAVSREKLMTGSRFNRDLFGQLGDLIAESMLDLAKRELVTQNFMRRIVIPAFQDESENHTIEGLKEKITKTFRNETIFPDRKGHYRHISELAIPVPFSLAEFSDTALFAPSFDHSPHFVAFNNERDRNFTDYYIWMYDDLHIPVFTLDKWAGELCKSPVNRRVSAQELEDLRTFYHFLSDYRESLFLRDNKVSSRYELAIISCIATAWDKLRIAPVILNTENELVSAYNSSGRPQVYLDAPGQYNEYIDAPRKDYSLKASETISYKVDSSYQELFNKAFRIPVYDNWQYVKENVLPKYTREDGRVLFEDINNFEEEYLRDFLKMISAVVDSSNPAEILSQLKKANIIKTAVFNNPRDFYPPERTYVSTSKEGIDLSIYYAPIPKGIVQPFGGFINPLRQLDEKFYQKYNVPIAALEKLGVIVSPVTDGVRADYSGRGDNYWIAQGDYCPHLNIDGLSANLLYIYFRSEEPLAKKKSAEILKLLQSIHKKLIGKVKKRKTNPYVVEERAHYLDVLNMYEWVYGGDGVIHFPQVISRFDLDENVYGDIYIDKETSKAIGFMEKEDDCQAEAFDYVDSLDERGKTIMFRQLAKELGYDLSGFEKCVVPEDECKSEQFDSNEWQSGEFPQRRVRNFDRLIEHVRQEFFCADPVRYEKVLRQIRTSKSPRTIRAYSLGMYQNESETQICQMCKKSAQFVDVTEIANYGIEMPQLNLCLCRNCSSRYKQFRDGNKGRFKEAMTKAIHDIDISSPAGDYEIALSVDCSVFFTQTHLAEIKEILTLLDQYGVPGQGTEEKKEDEPKFYERQSGKTTQEHSHQDSKDKERNHQRTSQTKTQERFPQIGSTVKHPSFGSGVITQVEGPYISVAFQRAGKKKFRFPDAFKKGFLILEN